MKKNYIRLINIIIILISFLCMYQLIAEKSKIMFIKMYLFILYMSIEYLIITLFHKNTIRENIKKYEGKYILEIVLISLIILNTFPLMIRRIPTKEKKDVYNHGRNIDQKDLYTCKKAILEPYYINKKEKNNYQTLFDKETIQKVKINIKKQNLDYLRYNAKEKPTVIADSIIINNNIIKNIGIKTKGRTTLLPLIKSNNNLFSYTIIFKECINKKNGFKENQKLLGLNKLSFNNMLGDPSKTKEYISYYLLTEMKVPTPEYTYAELTINNEYQGIYFMIEPINKSLTERTLNEKNDFLIKPEINGGDLLYDERLDKYIDKNKEFNLDSLLKDKKGNITLPHNNVLEKYNGIWENDLDTLKELYSQLPMFFKWLKKLNELNNIQDKDTEYFEEELNKIIDVDSLIRYWAVNTYIVNTDSYTTHVKGNYALYMSKKGKVTIIPWDYNYAFGGSNINNIDEIINYSIYNPTKNCTLEERPLINTILKNKKFKTKYEEYLKDVMIIATEGGKTSDNKTYRSNNLNKMIDEKKNLILKGEKRNNQAFYTNKEIIKAQENLKKIILLRTESVKKQLNNEETNIHSNIELNTLGGYHSIMTNKWNTKKD